MTQPTDEAFAHEMAGAFAHEIRTPLTSLTMALELGKMDAPEGELHFDAGLALLLRSSLDGLNELADEFQEVSRLQRGKLVLATEPLDLASILRALEERLPPEITLHRTGDVEASADWDRERLSHALAGIATGVYRCGDGSGDVTLHTDLAGATCRLDFSSGVDAGGPLRTRAPMRATVSSRARRCSLPLAPASRRCGATGSCAWSYRCLSTQRRMLSCPLCVSSWQKTRLPSPN